MPDDFASARIGRVLRGKYQLDRVLGVGGMATVYAATHRNRKQFAIKMLHPELSVSEPLRTRFLREGYVANSVNHDGAVSVIDDDVDEDGSAFLVMELLSGSSVEDFCLNQGGSLPIPLALSVGDQLLEVLDAAHRNGIVHRDLKPANLFLTRDGTLKVLDFGIARLRDAQSPTATATGATLGTPAFMPPEQALGQHAELDARSDLWALGATLFVMISGRFVHEGENTHQMLLKAATEPARSLASIVPGAPRSVTELIDRALAFDKQARWASAADMRAALRQAHQQAFGSPVSAALLASAADPAARTALAMETSQHLPPAAEQRVAALQPAEAAPASAPPAASLAAPSVVAAAVDAPTPPAPQPMAAAQATPVSPYAPAIVEVNIAAASTHASDRTQWPALAVLLIVLSIGGAWLLRRFDMLEPQGNARAGSSTEDRQSPPPAVEPSATPHGQSVRPTVAPSPTATVPSTAAAIAPTPAVVPPSVAAKPEPTRDVTAASAVRPEPTRSTNAHASPATDAVLAAKCARLLEQLSLGEHLTPQESALFGERCRK